MKAIFILFALFLLSSCGIRSSADSERDVIRIAYLPITHSAAVMMLPYVSGPDCDFRVELVRFTGWPEVVEALSAGHVDGASVLFEVAVSAFLRGSEWSVISLSHRDGNVLVVDNTIKDIHGLVGKTVAIPHAHSPHMTLLNKVLAREGLTINDINLIELSPAEMPFSMAARAISAYVVAEPWGSLAEYRGAGRILVNSVDVIPDSVCCLLVFDTQALMGREGLYEWLHDRFAQAAVLAANLEPSAIAVFRADTGFDHAIIQKSLQNTNFNNLEFTQDDYKTTVENVLRYGVLYYFPTFEEFLGRRWE